MSQNFLGQRHTRHFCAQCCDKKIFIFLNHRFQCPSKVSSYEDTTNLVLCFVKSLPWLVYRHHLTKLKIYFYRNFYRVQKYSV